MADSEWLAVLARLRAGFGPAFPPKDLRELRLVSRYRRKLSAMCASEVNRLHKIPDDGGIKLGGVVSDINGGRPWAMVSALIEGKSVEHMLGPGPRQAQAKARRPRREPGRRSQRTAPVRARAHPRPHRDAAARDHRHRPLPAGGDAALCLGRTNCLQTIPGVDEIAAALILIEIGDDMARSAAPNAWPAGPHSARATTRARASASRAARATATRSSASSCASAPTPRA